MDLTKRTIIIKTILTLITPISCNIEITPIPNPFLPLTLGVGKIIYNKHTFLHYINLESLETQVEQIRHNIIQIKKNTPEEFNINLRTILHNVRSEIDEKFNTLSYKFKNLVPYLKTRSKRGIINGVGTVHKWLFGTLDAEDGQRYDDAINKLEHNQQTIYNGLENQISLSNRMIDKFNDTLSTIYHNQLRINNAMTNQSFQQNITHSQSTKLITTISIAQLITSNCLTLIEFIDQINDAIIFAKLNSVNPSIIDLAEIKNMQEELIKIYPASSIPRFKNPLSNYLILSTQVTFTNSKIIFAIHMPLMETRKYSFLHILPIPINNTLFLPTQPFVIYSQNETQISKELCPMVEDTYYCPADFITNDACTTSIMQNQAPDSCLQYKVKLEQTMVQRIDNNIIIIPVSQETLSTSCSIDETHILKEPTLVKVTEDCTINIKGQKYSFSKIKRPQKLLILPKVETPILPGEEDIKPIRIKKPDFQSLQELKHEVRHLDPLLRLDEPKTYMYNSLITIVIIASIILSIYLWIKCFRRKLCCPKKISSEETEMETIRQGEPENSSSKAPIF